MTEFINNLPKAELHIHIEGSMEPELLLQLAHRNGIVLPYKNVEEIHKSYNFKNLQDFLDLYYEGIKVLVEEQDFYDLSMAYFEKAQQQNIIHVELFFDPQSHTSRGIAMKTIVGGIKRAMQDAEAKWGISSFLILCFLRHLSEEDAIDTLKEAVAFKEDIIGVGLDSTELGNPPEKFQKVFEMAHEYGFRKVAHAGEEGPAQYIWDSLSLLNIERLDHGIRAMEHDKLLNELANSGMGLTMCPVSNLKLQVVKDLKEYPLKEMLDMGIKVTVNSDDPGYFGANLNDNFTQITTALNLNNKELYQLAFNAFDVSFADETRKREMLVQLDQYFADFI